ncbi:MAG: carboxylating nicotinate-nucleotide diphosphorylase [Candidatus Diapherotrites archaeon]
MSKTHTKVTFHTYAKFEVFEMLSSEMKKQLLQILKNDISKGDITSALLKSKKTTAEIVLNETAHVSGTEEANFLFSKMKVKSVSKMKDGTYAKKGQVIMVLKGTNRNILSAERTALNILGRMSSVTSHCADAKKIIGTSKTQIAVTRKTMPGFNDFDKKAAKSAGVWPHRKNLNEAFLIKENHLKFFDSPAKAVLSAKKKHKNKLIEIETETMKEALNAASANPDIILLDNFSQMRAKKAIKEIRKVCKCKIELSGGISLKNLRNYNSLGADIISMGSLTTNAKSIDFSLRIKK